MENKPLWYVVQCKPRESFRAALHLENQNYTCFHPTYPVKRKVRGEIKVQIEPLFPHYLFVLLNKEDNWAPIRSTRGVNCLVRFNGVPARLDKRIIEALKEQCARLQGLEVAPLYQVGQRVLITDSCFKEIEAIITSVDGDERVTLLFNLCNRPQYVALPTHAVSLI